MQACRRSPSSSISCRDPRYTPTVDLVRTVGFSLITILWIVVVLTSTYSLTRLCDLPALGTVDLDAVEPPKVTAVIAARDEADHIENAICSLLAQRHVDLSVIVVNDGLHDDTPTILDRLAEKEDRLRIIHIDTLPERWIGKCYALHRGTSKARGRWILLTDADIGMTSEVIARAVAVAESERAHHICLLPRQRNATRLGQTSLLMLFLGMPDAFRKANRDKQGVGFGAFNLIRVDALRDIGGFESLRMEVVDDHQLGLLLHLHGKRTRGFFGGHDVEMDFARTPAEVVRALEKNAFAIISGAMVFGPLQDHSPVLSPDWRRAWHSWPSACLASCSHAISTGQCPPGCWHHWDSSSC